MRYTFVGDVHGKWEAVEHALSMDGKVVFVGDLQDSFDRGVEDHGRCFRLVLDAIKAGKAECIYGNHELSYMCREHRSSGWDKWRDAMFRVYEPEVRELFKPYLLLAPDLLVSHAGLTNKIWVPAELTLDLLPRVLKDWWPDKYSPMHWVGQKRGGRAPVGGLFWCDYRYEFEPVAGLRQVFGHTQLRPGEEWSKDGTWCIDNGLVDETGFKELLQLEV